MTEATSSPFVTVEALLDEGIPGGAVATAIERQGAYTLDRYSRLVLADDQEKAAVLDALGDRLLEKRFPRARARQHDPSFSKITLELFGWPADKRPDFEGIVADTGRTRVAGAEPSKRTRNDALKRAIFDAWDRGLPVNATASQALDYLARRDDTGHIVGRDGDELQWMNSSGGITRTTLRGLGERLVGYRRERESGA